MLLLLLAAQTAQAALHPADAVLYLETPDLAEVRSAYGSTALARLLADPDVRAVSEGLLGVDDPLVGLLGLLDGAAAMYELPPPSEVLFHDLRSFSFSISAAGDLELALRFETATARAEFETYTAPLVGRGWARVAEADLMLLGSQAHKAGELAARMRAEGASLADRPERFPGAEHFGEPEGPTVVEGFWIPTDDPLADFALAPLAAFADGLLGGTLGVARGGGHWRIHLARGRFVTESFERAGPWNSAVGVGSVRDSALALLHPGARVGWVVQFDPQGLAAQLAARLGDTPASHLVGDAAASLEPEVAFNLIPAASLFAAPDVRIVAGVAERDALVAALDAWVEGRADEHVSLRRSSYRGLALYTAELHYELGTPFPLPFDPLALFSPSIAVLDDRVICTTTARYAKDEIRRLTEGEGFPPGWRERAGIPAHAVELGFADWMGYLSDTYASARSLAPMAAALGAELPFDSLDLPQSNLVARFFEPGRYWKRRIDGGLVFHGESSFGPEAPLLVFFLPALLFAPDAPHSAARAPAWFDPAEVPARSAATRAALARVEELLSAHRGERGAYPDELHELERLFGGAELPRDGWDRPLRYRRAGEGYELWSVGPDGVDESGAGDDILPG